MFCSIIKQLHMNIYVIQYNSLSHGLVPGLVKSFTTMQTMEVLKSFTTMQIMEVLTINDS